MSSPPGMGTLTPVMSSIWTSSFRRMISPTRVASPSRTFPSPSTRKMGRAPSRGPSTTTTRLHNHSTSGSFKSIVLMFIPYQSNFRSHKTCIEWSKAPRMLTPKFIIFQNSRFRRPQSLRLREHF